MKISKSTLIRKFLDGLIYLAKLIKAIVLLFKVFRKALVALILLYPHLRIYIFWLIVMNPYCFPIPVF